jgi:hypothetical protein
MKQIRWSHMQYTFPEKEESKQTPQKLRNILQIPSKHQLGLWD